MVSGTTSTAGPPPTEPAGSKPRGNPGGLQVRGSNAYTPIACQFTRTGRGLLPQLLGVRGTWPQKGSCTTILQERKGDSKRSACPRAHSEFQVLLSLESWSVLLCPFDHPKFSPGASPRGPCGYLGNTRAGPRLKPTRPEPATGEPGGGNLGLFSSCPWGP